MRPTHQISVGVVEHLKMMGYHPSVVYMTDKFYKLCIEDIREHLRYPYTNSGSSGHSLDEFMGLKVYVVSDNQYSEHPDFIVY